MSVNEKIIAALAPLGCPVVPDLYRGKADTYIVFNYSGMGVLFADDAPAYDIYLVQVHLFAPFGRNTVEMRKRIRRLIFSAGFTWPAETDAGSGSRAEAHAGQHIVFECEIERAANPDG